VPSSVGAGVVASAWRVIHVSRRRATSSYLREANKALFLLAGASAPSPWRRFALVEGRFASDDSLNDALTRATPMSSMPTLSPTPEDPSSPSSSSMASFSSNRG
jgi:hypothetical protein